MPALQTTSSGIYEIVCVPTGKFYIGSSSNVQKRWGEHRSALRAGTHHSPYLQRAWNKHGSDSFRFSVVELTSPKKRLEVEQYWIDFTNCAEPNTGFNLATCTAAPMEGRRHTQATLDKISRAQKKRYEDPAARAKNSEVQRGRKASAATRLKMSEAQSKRQACPEYKAWASLLRKGKPCSAETRAKISASHKGMKHSSETRAKLRSIGRAQAAAPGAYENLASAGRAYWGTPGSREKAAAIQRGRKHTDEHKAKQSAALRGIKRSPETRARMSAAQLLRAAKVRLQAVSNV